MNPTLLGSSACPRWVRLGFSGRGFVLFLAFGSICGISSAETRPTAADGQIIYKVDEVEKAPTPKQEIHVRFPRSIRKEHGEVTLRFVVTTTGKVDQLTMVKFTDPDAVEPAYDAYEHAEFTPGIKGGKPVDTLVEVTEIAK